MIRILTFLLLSISLRAQTLDLAGEWQFALDPGDLGHKAGPATWNFPDNIQLPGTTAAQSKGEPLKIELNLEKPAMQHLHQRFPYIGPAWYQKSITIPADWAGMDIQLSLERVLWESRVWVDQRPVGKPGISLTTPHRYDLSDLLTPGKTHTLTLRIDNRPQVDIGSMGHAYTEETQTIWNGVIGELKLEALPRLRTENIGIRTLPDRSGLQLDLSLLNTSKAAAKAKLSIAIKAAGDRQMKPLFETSLRLPPGKTKRPITLSKLPTGISAWSEFNPAIHQLAVLLTSEDTRDLQSKDFGLRTFTTDGRHFLSNGQETFLRGNLECAIFPQTGHPDAAGPQWEKIMRVSKAHGLNHLRFHSWCPPEAAFEAADRHGIYLQVELPNWTFKMGKNPPVDSFLKTEGERILREYSHHPSFVLFSLGNELTGDLASMDALIEHFRALAPDLLYTSTSYAFSPRGLLPGPQDNFFISQKTKSGWVRGQGFLNDTFPSTDSDYAEGLKCLTIPLVTHEVGQYVVYPNVAELPKYGRTPLRSTALESIKADLEAKGLLADAPRFTRDSGKLAALLYKEDIERALRTKDLAGIQLLQLQDFPGQSTATVGLLDSFWDSKGVITPEAFRQFCAPVVPLVRMEKFVWQNNETFSAALELANFSGSPLTTGFTARLVDSNGLAVAEKTFDPAAYPIGNGLQIGRYEAPLAAFGKATRLDLVVSSADGSARNSWPVWVYPAAQDSPEVIVHRGSTDACLADLAAGKKVLLLPPAGAIRKALPARFIPVFWSPLHFPNQPGTLGATIDTDHPLWRDFPTDTHTNWQWWELTATSTAIDLTGIDPAIARPFRFIDKYNRNAIPTAIFEAKVGPGRLLVCTLDVESDPARRIVARQLRHALATHLDSPGFDPAGSLTPDQLRRLIGEASLSLSLSASSAHPNYPAALATDGNPASFWHSDWNGEPQMPISLSLDLLDEKSVAGLDYLPRQDQANGRIRDYQVQISRDGSKWINYGKPSTFPNKRQLQQIRFPKPVALRHLRLVALSEQSGNILASCAELVPVFTETGDVRELGIIPGFNDTKN